MRDLESLKNRHGYQSLFKSDGSLNMALVYALDSFLLGKDHCLALGDKRRILEYLEYAESGNGSEEIKKFDRELATWNK